MEIIKPSWSAPATICAGTTTQASGNLALHVGDDLSRVLANRRRLKENLALPAEPLWLNQVHGSTVAIAPQLPEAADACYTDQSLQICTVMTADCLPILLCTRQGQEMAAIHGGWRSLAAGIIEKTLLHFRAAPAEILAWLGPAICPPHYEVDQIVYEAFVSPHPELAGCFAPSRPQHYFADLYALARAQLQAFGIIQITGGEFCSFEDPRFYSYRRQAQTGRMATLIYRRLT